MSSSPETSRNRAIWFVRAVTTAAAGGALGLSWGFAQMADAYFSGKPPAPPSPPFVPVAAAPVQTAPPVITKVVHHSGYPPAGSGGPRPPSHAPGAAPAAPPKPKCHSTPSRPC